MLKSSGTMTCTVDEVQLCKWPSVIDGQAYKYRLRRALVLLKNYLDKILYRIHFWADLDGDRRVGGSRRNQNDYAFSVILVTHPKSYIETTDCRDFGGKPSEWSENFRNYVAWAEPDKKAFFAFSRVPIRLSCAQPTGNSLPQTNDTDGKPRPQRCAFC